MPLHRLYGLIVEAPQALPAAAAEGAPQVVITHHPFRFPSSAPANPDGYAYEQRSDGSIHVSWSELFDFVVSGSGRRIAVYSDDASAPEPVYSYLISQVLSVALLQQGTESLHAAAVSIGNDAIVLLGESGHGKSTLTATLLERGAKLITDDLLVIDARKRALPGPQRIKLHPATAAELGISWPHTAMNDGSGKHVFFVPADRCSEEGVPITGVLLLTPDAERVALEAVSATEAMRAVLSATFNPLHTDAHRLHQLLASAQQLARTIPFQRLCVPRNLDLLSAVTDLLPP